MKLTKSEARNLEAVRAARIIYRTRFEFRASPAGPPVRGLNRQTIHRLVTAGLIEASPCGELRGQYVTAYRAVDPPPVNKTEPSRVEGEP